MTASESLAAMAKKVVASPDGRSPDSEGGSKGRGKHGPYKHDETGLERVPLTRTTPAYPREIVERALELMEECRSVHAAQQALAAELEDKGLIGPSYNCMWRWAQERETLLDRLQVSRKDQLITVASEVALRASERMLTALDGISDSQVPVAYGIAMQKRTEWENTGNKQNQMNVQFNLVTRD